MCEVRRSRSSTACHRNSAQRLATCYPTLGCPSSSFLMQNSQQKCQMGLVWIIAEHKPWLRTHNPKSTTVLKVAAPTRILSLNKSILAVHFVPSRSIVTLTRATHSRSCKVPVFPLQSLSLESTCWLDFCSTTSSWWYHFGVLRFLHIQFTSSLSCFPPQYSQTLVDTQTSPGAAFILSTASFWRYTLGEILSISFSVWHGKNHTLYPCGII